MSLDDFALKLDPAIVCAGMGSTNYSAAFSAVTEILSDEVDKKKIVYFLSDGEPTVGFGLPAFDPRYLKYDFSTREGKDKFFFEHAPLSGQEFVANHSKMDFFPVIINGNERGVKVLQAIVKNSPNKVIVNNVEKASELAKTLIDLRPLELKAGDIKLSSSDLSGDLMIKSVSRVEDSGIWKWVSEPIGIPSGQEQINFNVNIDHPGADDMGLRKIEVKIINN